MPPIVQRMALLKIAARMSKTTPRMIKPVPPDARDIRQHRDSIRSLRGLERERRRRGDDGAVTLAGSPGDPPAPRWERRRGDLLPPPFVFPPNGPENSFDPEVGMERERIF